jgi:menaquinone-dependent protoporphyrinogen IX oxidase
MSKILITYSTNSGSTGEVAEEIGKELLLAGHTVSVKAQSEVSSLDEFDSVVVGAPMIFGWHAATRSFIRKNRVALSTKKVAYFACAMRLTKVPGESLPDVNLALDPSLAAEPVKAGSLNLKERFTTLGYYLKPMLQAATEVKPLSIAFFNGKLEMFRLKWWQAAFVMIVVQGVPGDYRDWDYIKNWAKEISGLI